MTNSHIKNQLKTNLKNFFLCGFYTFFDSCQTRSVIKINKPKRKNLVRREVLVQLETYINLSPLENRQGGQQQTTLLLEELSPQL